MNEWRTIRAELASMADTEKAKILSRFFKTGTGEYGEGDKFLGIIVPKVRKIVKLHRNASEQDIQELIKSPFHEERMTALFIMVEQYKKGDEKQRKAIYELYFANLPWINNWDLVDLTAPHIVGNWLHRLRGNGDSTLTRLALSNDLWERRIAMLSTFYFIQKGESKDALQIAELLINDKQDLIHKAVGWMLREVGKRCSINEERVFLDKHAATMPRTMLRYAIERFPVHLKNEYMAKKAPRKKRGQVPFF
jgi:3-methyladenine DNA glycosylase AlkD